MEQEVTCNPTLKEVDKRRGEEKITGTKGNITGKRRERLPSQLELKSVRRRGLVWVRGWVYYVTSCSSQPESVTWPHSPI
jgi:hypothetical protein